MRYEDEQFQIDDETASQKQSLYKPTPKGQSLIVNNCICESTTSNHKYKTIDINEGIGNSKGFHSKSVSVYANRSLSKVLPNNRAAALGKEARQIQSMNFNGSLRPKATSTKNPAFKRREQSQDNGVKISSRKEQIEANKKNLKINLQPINKHKRLQLTLINKSQNAKISDFFSHSKSELVELSIEQISRLTNKLKEWIKKLDISLSEKINKAIRVRQIVKSQQSAPQRLILLLKANIVNNNTIINAIQDQHSKLQGQEGQFKEEQYELMLDKEMDRLNRILKQQSQNIILLRKQAKLDENKINQTQYSAKYQKKLDFLKFDILQCRRDEAKNSITLEKEQSKFQQMGKLNMLASSRYQQLLEMAKATNINITSDHMVVRHHQLKQKIQKIKISIASSENYLNRSLLHARNEIKNMKKQLRQYEEDIKGNNQRVDSIGREINHFLENNKQKLEIMNANHHKLKLGSHEKGFEINPFIKNRLDQQKSKNQLRIIRQSNETNLQETQYHNQFLNVPDQSHNYLHLEFSSEPFEKK